MTAEIGLTTVQGTLAAALLQVGAIKFGEFRLKLHETNPDAPLSPIYIDLRTADNPKPGPLTPAIVTEIGRQLYLLAAVSELSFDRVAGVPNAGDPLAKAVSEAPAFVLDKELHVRLRRRIPVPLLKLEKHETTEGRRVQGEIQGVCNPRDRVLLVDDLITAAHSKLEAIQLLEDRELVVHDVLVVLDREQGGAEQLAARGHRLHTILKLSKLLLWYKEQGLIPVAKYDETMVYVAANK